MFWRSGGSGQASMRWHRSRRWTRMRTGTSWPRSGRTRRSRTRGSAWRSATSETMPRLMVWSRQTLSQQSQLILQLRVLTFQLLYLRLERKNLHKKIQMKKTHIIGEIKLQIYFFRRISWVVGVRHKIKSLRICWKILITLRVLTIIPLNFV